MWKLYSIIPIVELWFVLFIFNLINFDKYFDQIDKPEVAVRRQISGKKDNYFLDRKVVK